MNANLFMDGYIYNRYASISPGNFDQFTQQWILHYVYYWRTHRRRTLHKQVYKLTHFCMEILHFSACSSFSAFTWCHFTNLRAIKFLYFNHLGEFTYLVIGLIKPNMIENITATAWYTFSSSTFWTSLFKQTRQLPDEFLCKKCIRSANNEKSLFTAASIELPVREADVHILPSLLFYWTAHPGWL